MTWESIDRLTPIDQPAETLLDEAFRKDILDRAAKYPAKRAALLPALHAAQEKLGPLSDQVMVEIAELLAISPADVLDTATFYDMFTREERGRHLIGVCESLSCELCGCNELLDALTEKLGITPGQTSNDKRFSLVTMQCIGACDFAPAMLIDGELHKTVSVEHLDEILRKYT
ncbi:MAG: NADH-quinone oxidoreductase subunit NuoE [Phycisphaerae bacterium]|nr:NADH-quinone oxidoreductase subunit NuoE [Phycisphaerae bacterium]